MKSFHCAWAQQNYALTLADKLGLSSCLQKKTFGHCCPLSVNHVYTTETLGKEQKKLCKRLQMKHYHDKGLLGWLDCGMASTPPPQIFLDKQVAPEQWDIWKLAASTEELGT